MASLIGQGQGYIGEAANERKAITACLARLENHIERVAKLQEQARTIANVLTGEYPASPEKPPTTLNQAPNGLVENFRMKLEYLSQIIDKIHEELHRIEGGL